jgi:hypothetical protein
MKATLICSCGKVTTEVEAPTLADLGQVIAGTLVTIHATSPHEVHAMTFHVEDTPPMVERELVLQCLRKGCEREREMKVMVPYVLVGAMTLVFHTAHEGHRMSLSYDGKTWESPAEA